MNQIILDTDSIFSTTVNREPDLQRLLKINNLKTHFLGDKTQLDFPEEDVFAIVARADQPFTIKEMQTYPALRLISPFGSGFDHIDLEAAKAHDITVTNVPLIHGQSVAELTISFMLALGRKIFSHNSALKRGLWQRDLTDNLFDKQIGIVGLGSIGKEVAKIAQALGMTTVAYDVVPDEIFFKTPNVARHDLETLVKTCDIITLHMPLTDETKHMIDKEMLSLMKPNAFLINTSRGEIIDEAALLTALNQEQIAGAALDVFSQEPPFDNSVLRELISHPKVIATPHIASTTLETHKAVAEHIIYNIIAVKENRLQDTDKLIVLEKDQIKEQGSPQSLLKDKNTYFYKVYNIRENT